MSFSALFFGFAFGVFGFFFLKQGRKQAQPVAIVSGLALMIYPYFIENPWIVFGIGITLCVVAYKSLQRN